jgi:hypothetical protein
MLTDMNRTFLSRAWRAALLFALATAFGALAARPGHARSVSAPSEVSQLLAFAGEQPEPGEGGEGDSIPRIIEPKNLPEAPPQDQPPPSKTPPPLPPTFAAPDTSSHADSIRAFPGGGGAPLETLGAPPRGPFVTNAAAGIHPRPRRGLLGVPPLALLAGLIALHIFVVTKVVK